MEKFKINFLPVLLFALFLGACQDDGFFHPDPDQQHWVANYSQQDLNTRVRIPAYEEMLSFYDVPTSVQQGRIAKMAESHSVNYVLVLRAEVAPPAFQQQILRATHVEIEGDRAFVAYNTEGEKYLGGIEIFDISDIKHPVLISQVIIDDADFSAVTVHNNKIYLAGAKHTLENNEELQSPALVEIITLENDQVEGEPTILDITGFVATDVKVHNDKLYVVSGTNGGLSIYDLETLRLLETKMMDDARSIAFSQDHFVVMQGTPARITSFLVSDGTIQKQFTVGGADVPESKSIVDVQDNFILVPAGAEGLKVIDAQTGAYKAIIPLPHLEDVKPEFLVTNSVSVNEEKIFIANGAAGLYVAEKEADNVHILGSVYFQASTNYIKSKENIIFVATGTGGLKILEIVEYNPGNGGYIPIGDWDDDGVPSYLCERATAIDQQLTQKIFGEFISMDDITLRHPEWFATDVLTDLPLIEDTDLSITFVHEGAGWQNTLGYYTYDPNQPPQQAEGLQNFTVLFPNTSYQSSGGGLLRGDKICLENLKAGTNLGFFLVTGGWKDAALTKGVYTHHTTPAFNKTHPQGLKQNSLLLYDETSGHLILTFEDIRRPGGDKDFDDALFLIKLSNPEAIDLSRFSRIN